MNIYKKLNMITDYIEQNLYEEITPKKLTLLTGINYYSLNNAFSLISGYTIKDYIRKRRLSNAFIYLKDRKVIDVAIMCGYDSPVAFSRAFKKFHGFNPAEIKQSQQFNYFPKITFKENTDNTHNIKITYKDIDKFVLFGNCCDCEIGDFNAIEEFWKTQKALYPKITSAQSIYGLTIYNKGKLKYYIALQYRFAKTNQRIELPSGTYMSVELNSIKASDISKISSSIINEYPQDKGAMDIEIYKGNCVELLYKL